MLSGFKHGAERDLSTELADPREWQLKDLRYFDILLDVSALAYDPTSGLLALGTDSGHIHILGGPSVVVSLENGAPVKSLQFASATFKLVCLDGSERLRVWDLSNLQDSGKPRLVSSTSANEPISAISSSPSHAQVFVIPLSSNAKLKVFDLVTSTWSSHSFPNFWGIHEDRMLASGVIIEKRPNSRQGMLITPHPRNLELLFVAYEGGVALCDLQQMALIHAYELILPPGAPGGSGYAQLELMTSRYPPVTALSVHPNGHMFAVGHLNGEITFWATEDEDKPLTCITIDEEDIHIVNGEKLAVGTIDNSPEREPIFKLVWSGYSNSDDPRGGSSTLTILGGRNDNASGVSVLQFPPYNPPHPQADTSGTLTSGLHPFFRAAMRQSVIAQDSYFYTTPASVVDFLLIPKDSPHFGGSFDPQQIMVIMEAQGGTRSIESRMFPPPQFAPSGQPQPANSTPQAVEAAPSLDDDLAATIAAMGIADDPAEIELPLTFWNGKHSPNSVHIIKLERDAHNKLIRDRKLEEVTPFNGGEAYAEDTHDARLAKFAPHQIAISDHQDGTIRFMDLDPQLLLEQAEGVLTSSYPHHAKELQIDVLDLLGSPAVADHIPSATLASIRVASVQLSSQTLDTVVALDAGQVIVYKLDGGSGMYRQSDEQDVICLEHISAQEGRRFYPLLMIAGHHGSVTSMTISDIGLLAVAYADGTLLVYDLKLHSTVMKEKSKPQKKALFHRAESDARISCLSWTVSGVKRDSRPRVRLIAVGSSGDTRVHTLERRSDDTTWEVTNQFEAEGIEEAFTSQDSSFIFEAKTGFRSRADAHGLSTISSPEILAGGQDDRHWIWVIAGAKGARAYLNINGDRVAKADWPAKFGKVIEVKMVERTDAMVLVAYTTQSQALVYSLPKLELLHAFDMPYSGKATPVISANSTGDYLLCSRHPSASVIQKIVYGTLFGQRRSYYKQPLIDLGAKRKPMPPQPQPVGLGPTSVMNTLASYVSGPRITTGEDVDFIFTGRQGAAVQSPNTGRPVQNTRGNPPAAAGNMPDVNAMGQQIGQGASAMGQQIGQGASAVFGRLQSALGERGEMLDSLQNSMKNLQQGSQNALNQARIAAAKQGAKSWFSGF